MTDLQKDRAIFDKMLEIANEVFSHAVENCKPLQNTLKESGGIRLQDITAKKSIIASCIYAQTGFEMKSIDVDTFHCEFNARQVFILLAQFKKIAKVSGDICFTHDVTKGRNQIYTVQPDAETIVRSKNVTNFVLKKDDYPAMQNVMLELNVTNGVINVYATDLHRIAHVTNCSWKWRDGGATYRALFSPSDWKRICDYEKKHGDVSFNIYERVEDEQNELMVAVLGKDKVVRSDVQHQFPNCKSAIPSDWMYYFQLEDPKVAQSLLSRTKSEYVAISVYRGSDQIYFDTEVGSVSFKLVRPSNVTMGRVYTADNLRKIKLEGIFFPTNDSHKTLVKDSNINNMVVGAHSWPNVNPLEHRESREVKKYYIA